MTDDERDRRMLERRLLGLKPWELAPSDVDDGPCPYPRGTGGFDSWGKAVQLKKQLDKLLAEKDPA